MTAADTATAYEGVYSPGFPLELFATVGAGRRGPGDPTTFRDGHVQWRTVRTPTGIASLALRMRGSEVLATAWGTRDALDHVPRLCGSEDDPSGFDASLHPVVAESAAKHPGLRLTRNDQVFESLAGAIIEQKVTGLQAFRAWRVLVTQFGERVPGPTPRPLYVPPVADTWRHIPSWKWHRAGVEPPQSRAVVMAAGREPSLSRAFLAAPDGGSRDRVLTSLPGVGIWTSAETRIRAIGDPDAVSVGDFHLAHEVGYALTGRRTDDAGMLELLEPWAGQRQRAVRLILASGAREPRRGPRLAPEDHRIR